MIDRKVAAIAGGVTLLAGFALCVAGGYVMIHASPVCHNFAFNDRVVSRNSIGLTLPVPIVQACNLKPLQCLPYIAGCGFALLGLLLLLRYRVSKLALLMLTVAVMTLAIAVPFVPNSDPYAYALYAYEGAVLGQSPYVAHDLAANGITATFLHLFPGQDNQIRSAVNYGPAFVGFYSLVVGPFGWISLKAMLIAERVVGALTVVVLAIVFARTQPAGKQRYYAYAAIALNPIVVLQSVSFTHGDIFALLLLAIALRAYQVRRYTVTMILCVLAVEVRVTAVLACAALLYELIYQRRYATVARCVAAGAGALAVTGVIAKVAFGTFHVVPTGTLLSSRYDSPALIVLSHFMGFSGQSVVLAMLAGVGAACVIAYAALRERFYELLPLAALVAVPIVRAWYAQILAPFAVLAKNKPYRYALWAFMTIAFFNETIALIDLPSMVLYAQSMVFVQYLVPLATYATFALIERRRALRAPLPVAA